MAIAVQVSDRYGSRVISTGAVGHRRLECAISPAEQHAYDSTITVRVTQASIAYNQIRLAVAVDVPYGHRGCSYGARTEIRRRQEGAIAIAQQHTDDASVVTAAAGRGLALVGDDQIGLSVPIHVRNDNGIRSVRIWAVTEGRAECSIAVA